MRSPSQSEKPTEAKHSDTPPSPRYKRGRTVGEGRSWAGFQSIHIKQKTSAISPKWRTNGPIPLREDLSGGSSSANQLWVPKSHTSTGGQGISLKVVERSEPTPTMGQTFARHAGHSEEKEGIPWQGDLTLEGQESGLERYRYRNRIELK